MFKFQAGGDGCSNGTWGSMLPCLGTRAANPGAGPQPSQAEVDASSWAPPLFLVPWLASSSYLFICLPFPLGYQLLQQRPCFIYLCITGVCLAPRLVWKELNKHLLREHTEFNKCSVSETLHLASPDTFFHVLSVCAAVPSLSQMSTYLNPTLSTLYYWVFPNKHHMSVCIQHLKSQLQCRCLASVTTMTPQVWQTGLGAAGSGTEEKQVLSVRHPGGLGQVMKNIKRGSHLYVSKDFFWIPYFFH